MVRWLGAGSALACRTGGECVSRTGSCWLAGWLGGELCAARCAPRTRASQTLLEHHLHGFLLAACLAFISMAGRRSTNAIIRFAQMPCTNQLARWRHIGHLLARSRALMK